MVKICPKCGAKLKDLNGGYMCFECGEGMFGEDEVITPTCPSCGKEAGDFVDDQFWCYSCSKQLDMDDIIQGKNAGANNDLDFEEPDYDSMINNGDRICLNCTYWSVSPYGASHGMVCRRNHPTSGPGDSCSDFVQSSHFASYGSEGQYQFNETGQDTANKLRYWRNNR